MLLKKPVLVTLVLIAVSACRSGRVRGTLVPNRPG